MYHTHWGLSDTPFQSRSVPEQFYLGAGHEEAIARLQYLVDHQRQLGLLLGPPGSGKSMLFTMFADECREARATVVRLNLTAVLRDEFPLLVAEQLGVRVSQPVSTVRIWRETSDRLAISQYQQRKTVVLLDDADRAADGIPEQVMRLMHLVTNVKAPITVLLSAQKERLDCIPRDLLQLVELRIDLDGWTVQDTANYLDTALTRVGRGASLFESGAVRRLHELSGGLPRRVNQLADLALLAGAGGNLSQISAATIDAVSQELTVPSH